MLPTTVQLYDINDVEGFVCAAIQRSGITLSRPEHEELVSEGVTILYDLAERFEPQRAGYATAGRFSGFAAQFLPRRLGDAWHASNPGHRRLTAADGSRSWHYEPSPVSIDSDEPLELIAPGITLENLQEDMPRIRDAIVRMEPWQQLGIQRMVNLLLDGYGWDEIARQLSLSREQVAEMREQLEQSILFEAVV